MIRVRTDSACTVVPAHWQYVNQAVAVREAAGGGGRESAQDAILRHQSESEEGPGGFGRDAAAGEGDVGGVGVDADPEAAELGGSGWLG